MFLGSMILLSAAPGPDTLYLLPLSMTRGARAGIATSCGMATGSLVHTVLLAFGVSPIICAHPMIFLSVKIAGTFYLLWLAFCAWRSRNDLQLKKVSAGTLDFRVSVGGQFLKGFCMSSLNPKLILIFLAIFPQFLPSVGTFFEMARNILIYGFVFALQAAVVLSLISACAGTLHKAIIKNPKIELILNCITVVILLCIALSILFVKNNIA